MKKFHISRWKYWYGYSFIALLVWASIWSYDSGMDYFGIFTGFLAAFLFVLFEFLVRKKKLLLGDNGIMINGASIPYSDVSVSVSQSSFQRLLGFGDVKVNDFVLKDFQWPFRLERLVAKRRGK